MNTSKLIASVAGHVLVGAVLLAGSALTALVGVSHFAEAKRQIDTRNE
jgi:hypothetical protein